MTYPQTAHLLGLTIVGVFDPHVPNAERIVLRARHTTSLAGHGLCVGIKSPTGVYPLHDNVFWFPDIIVEPPSWIIVYTGTGTTRQTQMPNGDPALTLHWGRSRTMFNEENISAFVFRAAEVEIGNQWLPPATMRLSPPNRK